MQLREYILQKKYVISPPLLEVWVPHESHVKLFGLQASQLEEFLKKHLQREDVRVSLKAKPEAFPEIKALHISEERWQRLLEINPLVAELRRLAKGQVLPQEEETRFTHQQDSST
ncbi:MAG: hypothetical protein RMK19_02160 [Bacteroidia bacterium]|nr:hypothetical protein [Bacteroidia bacterium]MDW8014799.1 hypothetical protein [Bacteroidia bacterium]